MTRRGLTILLAAATLWTSTARAHAPHDVAKAIAFSPDYANDRTVIASLQLTEHFFIGKSTDGGKSWAEYGREVAEDGINSLVCSPDFANDQTVFAGTNAGGIYISTDGGLMWDKSNAGLRGMKVNQIAVSPTFAVDRTLFAATAQALNRSTDGGVTWTDVNVGLPNLQNTVVAFGGSANVVYAGTSRLFRSLDGGSTWSSVVDFRRRIKSLAVSPSFSTDFTLAVSFGTLAAGVLVSTDGGASWVAMLGGLSDVDVNVVAIAGDGRLFAITETAATFNAPGPGAPWTLESNGFEMLATQTDSHYHVMALSPTFVADGEIFVGGHEGLFRSKDHGVNWRQLDIYHQRINRFLEISPNFAVDDVVLAGNYGAGPMRYNAATGAWQALAYGVSSLWCGSMEFSPDYATDGTIFYGYVGTWRSTDRGDTWTKVLTQSSVTRTIAMSPQFAADGQAFLNASDFGTYRSTDHGVTWTLQPHLWDVRTHIQFSRDYLSDSTIFASVQFDGMHRSTDDGQTFVNISGPMAGLNIRAYEQSPDFIVDGTIFAGTVGHGLFRSTDRGSSWSRITTLPSGAEDTIETLALSPNFGVDQTLFAVSFHDGIFLSTDGGTSWTPRNTGLPIDAKRVVRVSPNFTVDQTVVVTTHDWTFISIDAGVTWQKIEGFIRVNDRHPTVFPNTQWATSNSPSSFGAQFSRSSTVGDERVYEFYGDGIEWHAIQDSSSGIAEVYLDDVLVATVDLYSATTVESASVWTQSFATPDWHEVRIRVTGQMNASSTGVEVKTDGFLRRF